MKALLFIHGVPPKELPDVRGYELIACTDGAYLYLKDKGFDLDKLDFISGDFDSHPEVYKTFKSEKIIYTPNQEFTDFEKALDVLKSKGICKVDVYGGSGGEMDHFLGNLTAAYRFYHDMEVHFFDEFSTYFFLPKEFVISNVQGKMISLYPYPIAKGITTKGLRWPLQNESLDMYSRIGTRNFAVDDKVQVQFNEGDMLIFIANEKA